MTAPKSGAHRAPAALQTHTGDGEVEMPVRGADQDRGEKRDRSRPGANTRSLLWCSSRRSSRFRRLPSVGQLPLETQVRIPPSPPPPLNVDTVKNLLLAYQATDYDGDVAAVFAAARAHVEQRAGQVAKPALVLDIDETSLSNWSNIKANNFGFIRDGACDLLPNGPCGFRAWILQAVAPVIMPALNLFNAAKANGVSVFFITGRRDRERQATMWNLDRAGFEGWAKLATRPDDDARPTIQPFKTEERRKIEDAGYTIIANVGDQQSDLDGGFARVHVQGAEPVLLHSLRRGRGFADGERVGHALGAHKLVRRAAITLDIGVFVEFSAPPSGTAGSCNPPLSGNRKSGKLSASWSSFLPPASKIL